MFFIQVNFIFPLNDLPTLNNKPVIPNDTQLEFLLNAAYGSSYINDFISDSDDVSDSIQTLWRSIKTDTVLIVSSLTGEILHDTTVKDIVNNWDFYSQFHLSY